MNNIENTYIKYDQLISALGGEDIVRSRIQQISQEMIEFLKVNQLEDIAYIHEMALSHAIMDYFSDIQRLKDYQQIEHVNEIKIKAYETFWLLKRKPLQLSRQIDDDRFLYVNEKFLLTRLTSFMLGDNINMPIVGEKSVAFKNFLDTLYYYLKFRKCDAQSIELMLLAFKAGQIMFSNK
ncbi:MAG: hypothetical protein HFH05_03450 [Lachnospiraceae bacterium]|nr:hypothetical protein [Lachnospiraceae bacterium]